MIVCGFLQYELKVKLEFRELWAEKFWKELRKTERKKNNKVNLYAENYNRITSFLMSTDMWWGCYEYTYGLITALQHMDGHHSGTDGPNKNACGSHVLEKQSHMTSFFFLPIPYISEKRCKTHQFYIYLTASHLKKWLVNIK